MLCGRMERVRLGCRYGKKMLVDVGDSIFTSSVRLVIEFFLHDGW